MLRVATAILWAAMGACLMYAYALQGGDRLPVFLLLGGAVLCAVVLVGCHARQRSRTRTLPHELRHLWYRTSPTSIALTWQWRRSDPTRLQVMRSASVPARRKDDGTWPAFDRLLVYDGNGEQVVDNRVVPGATYHYAVWVLDRRGRWSEPVRLPVVAMDAECARVVEASFSAPTPYLPGPEGLDPVGPFGRDLPPERRDDPYGVDELWSIGAPLTIMGKFLGGLLTDLILTLRDGFADAGDGTDDAMTAQGWTEVR